MLLSSAYRAVRGNFMPEEWDNLLGPAFEGDAGRDAKATLAELETRAFRGLEKDTPLAATALGIITLGATIITAKAGVSMAAVPFVVCLLSFFVAFGRWRLAPIQRK